MQRREIRTPSPWSRLTTGLAFITIVITIATMLCAVSASAGGHEETGKLEHRVTTEGKSGLNLWLSELYNDQRLLYSLVVTLTMAILGICVAQLTELFLRLAGAKKPPGTR
ncbi:MAG: hypothetical protein AB1744_08605 [Candidatus Zixiibacteriota bacterium]